MSNKCQPNLTDEIVKRQATAMNCNSFEVGVYDSFKERMLIKVWNIETLFRSIAYLKYENMQKKHIYIRPKDEHMLSLVDDLNEVAIDRMKRDGFEPALIIETSPKNYQVWLNHGRVLSMSLSTEVSRELAKRYGGDPGSADWRHFGRLAGFTNCKPKYQLDNGYYPYVQLHDAAGQAYQNAHDFIQLVEQNVKERLAAEQIQREVWKQKKVLKETDKTIHDFRNNPAYEGDYHRADLAYATYALAHGLSFQEIESAILTRDLSHKGNHSRQLDYIKRTVAKADEYLKQQ